MAPGVNGSGKHTGTVPKSKTHNDGRRESDNRRDPSINQMSNNLAPFDWQQIPEASQNPSLKPSNTRACDNDCYDVDGAVSHEIDNRRRRLVSDEQGIQPSYLPLGYPPASVKPTPNPRQFRHNTHRLTCFSQPSLHSPHINQPHAAYHMMMASDEEEGASSFDSIRSQQLHPLSERNGLPPEWVDQGGSGEGRANREHVSPSGSDAQMRGSSKPRDERDRNILPERENKSNITKMPDRNQVLSRLNQIRDYINQTTSLMDKMQHSRDPRVVAECCKLTKMLMGLRDSEKKLEDLLSTLKNLAECGEIDISDGCMLESVDYEHLQRFSQLLEVLKRQEEMYFHLCSRNWGKMKQSNPDVRRTTGQAGRNLSRENEMNSQMSNTSYHSSDMAGAVAKSSEAGHRNELRAKLQKPEIEQAAQNEGVNSSQGVSRSPIPEVSPSLRKGKLDHLKERIQALKELYENRNQLMELLGDEDEELSTEHHALQNKLEDLQQKKSQMDQLVQELRSLNSFIPEGETPEASNEPHRNEPAQEVSNTENESEQPEHDIQEVLKNMEELKHMKERLAVLQGMMNAAGGQSQASGRGSLGNDGAIGGDKEDNAINIRRERENSREPPSSSKPDNISLSSEAGSVPNSDERQLYLSTQELERKTLKLQEAKLRLQQLERLLDVMQDGRKDSASLTSEQYAQLMQTVGDDEGAAGDDNRRDSCKDQESLVNVADDQSLHSNSMKSSQKRYGTLPTEEASSFIGMQHTQQLSRSRSSSTRGSEDVERRQNRSVSPLPSELSVEALQAMTQNLREQAMTIRSERDRLAAVKWQITQRQRAEPPLPSPPPSSSASTSSASSLVRRVKNLNTLSIDTQTCRQMFQAELQAKRRELEELMRKDRGHQTSINQDVCSEISAAKTDTPGFSHVTVEGTTTTNATWGGSTQGTLDDLAERDIEIQDQSGGYSSDEGRNEDEAKDGTNFQQASSFQEQRIGQLNVSVAREQPNIRSHSAQRELLNISLDSQGRPKTSIQPNISNSNTSSTLSNLNSSVQGVARSSQGRSPVHVSQVQQLQQSQPHSTSTRNHVPTSHNLWKKDSHEGTCPRAVWTPSVHARQENLCSADELVADGSTNSNSAAPTSSFPSVPPSLHHLPQTNPPNSLPPTSLWWQQQAQHLQNQLEATSALCHSLMTEQQHHSSGQGCSLPGLTGGYNLAHSHPIGFAAPPAPSSWPFSGMASPWMMTPTSLFPSSDHSPSSLAFHSCASHQLQQQQVLLTLSQCCHLLWLQHRELASLQATVQGIQERVGHESRVTQDEDELRTMQMQHPQLQQHQVLPHSLPYPNRASTPNTQSSYPVPMSVAQQTPVRVGGIVTATAIKGRLPKPPHPPSTFPEAIREGMTSADISTTMGGASGVSSAHSLPNLCASGTTSMMGLPHLIPHQTTDAQASPGAAPYSFPSEHLQPPPPPLGAASFGHTDHWALHPGAATRGPPVALNNQVPPGIRANNYWDNFRSYSRQNLLSTSSKSNEGFPHIPSPLIMRSNNFLRTASHGPPLPQATLNASPIPVTPAARHSVSMQKEKLNTDQQTGPSLQPNTNFISQTSGLASDVSSGGLYGAVGFTSQDLVWESQTSPQTSHTKDERVSIPDDASRRRPTRERGGLFEVLRESVYSEVATLIAQNENRPHYLIQLFRDLQMISCDALRQRTLHTIHRIVSRYLQENGKDPQSGQLTTPLMESEAGLGLDRECDSSGDEDVQDRNYRVPGEVVNYTRSHEQHSGVESKHQDSETNSQHDSHGIDEAAGAASYQKRREHLDKNIQSMLEQLLPLLKPHFNEPSSFMLLQNICLLAFQFLSSSINADTNKTKDNAINTSMPFHQLNSLLEETCLAFEGCKLKDVGEELLISIGEVIIKALTSSNNVGSNSRKIPEDIEEIEEESIETGEASGQRAAGSLEEERDETEVEAMNENCCDEDLAEADQSLGSGVGMNSEMNESVRQALPCNEASAVSKIEEATSVSFMSEENFIILDMGRHETNGKGKDSEAKTMDEPRSGEPNNKTETFLECNGNSENDDMVAAEAMVDSMSISSDEVKNPPVVKTEVKIQASNPESAQSNWEEEEEIAIAAEEDINKNTQGDASRNF